MNFRASQQNFSKGEIGPHLYGRFDVDAYASGVKLARNVQILKYGGLDKRPGLQFVTEVLDKSQGNRLFPFQFNMEQTYALEMGQGYMSPCADGGRIIEDELVITGITNAVHAQITAAYHGYSVGNRVYLTGIEGEIGALLNGRVWGVVAATDASNFTIDADTTGLGVFTSATGGTTRTEAPTPDPVDPVVPDPVEDPSPPVITKPGGNLRPTVPAT